MVEPRVAVRSVTFVDNYCAAYEHLFPEVKSFEVFESLPLGMISDLPHKSLLAIHRHFEFVATNDLAQATTDVVQNVCDVRWKIEVRAIPPSHGGMLGSHLEEFHRVKQLTGVAACVFAAKREFNRRVFGRSSPQKSCDAITLLVRC